MSNVHPMTTGRILSKCSRILSKLPLLHIDPRYEGGFQAKIFRVLSKLPLIHIDHFKNYVCIAIPKTGSTTVRSMCRRGIGDGTGRHETARSIIREIGMESWQKKFTFATVRNPYARVVSIYHVNVPGHVLDSKTYFCQWAKALCSEELYPCRRSAYIADRWNQVEYIKNDEGDILVDFIVHLENIEEDMKMVCQRLNIPFSGVPHINKGRISCDYRDYYDDEAREVVGNWFREDLEQFGYDFDGLIAP
ncbi:MAG: sulfotransferase family 2 domain-containing protein [Gammaproteobacteria bacterium]|nr:sulfotransferase family 2 domain-containing protein [Gammaproteobacteria bacterium]